MPLHAMTKVAVFLPLKTFGKRLGTPIVRHSLVPRRCRVNVFLDWPKNCPPLLQDYGGGGGTHPPTSLGPPSPPLKWNSVLPSPPPLPSLYGPPPATLVLHPCLATINNTPSPVLLPCIPRTWEEGPGQAHRTPPSTPPV